MAARTPSRSARPRRWWCWRTACDPRARRTAAADLGAEGEPPAALVLVATAALPLAEVVRAQVEASLAQQPEALRVGLMGQLERAMAQVIDRATVPEDLFAGLKPLFPANCGPLLQIELARDPRELAARYAGPVLVLAGALDAQVPADPHAGALEAAFQRRAEGSCDALVVPSASHNLKRVEKPGDLGFVGPVVPEALDALGRWVRERL